MESAQVNFKTNNLVPQLEVFR